MTDRELLELAAKAAGYASRFDVTSIGLDVAYVDGHRWNPLTDDGDAFRLAVKLYMKVYPGEVYPWDDKIADYSHECSACVDEDECPDVYAATRRAIVIAAANIGKLK